MISISTIGLVAALQAVPCEYVIDFGAEATPFAYGMVLDFVTRDGGGLSDVRIDFTKDSKPEGCRDFLEYVLQKNGFATRHGPGSSLIVTGMAKGNKSPIKSVTLKSDKVIPVQIRWVPLAPEKKKEKK